MKIHKTFFSWFKSLSKNYNFTSKELACAAWEYQQIKIERLQKDFEKHQKTIKHLFKICQSALEDKDEN
jgi:hypothetical protein